MCRITLVELITYSRPPALGNQGYIRIHIKKKKSLYLGLENERGYWGRLAEAGGGVLGEGGGQLYNWLPRRRMWVQ